MKHPIYFSCMIRSKYIFTLHILSQLHENLYLHSNLLAPFERRGSAGSGICQPDSEHVHLTRHHRRGLVHLPPRSGSPHPRSGCAPFHPSSCQASIRSWTFKETQWVQEELGRLKCRRSQRCLGCVTFFCLSLVIFYFFVMKVVPKILALLF